MAGKISMLRKLVIYNVAEKDGDLQQRVKSLFQKNLSVKLYSDDLDLLQ